MGFLKHFEYSQEELRSLVKKAVQKRNNCEPKFYAVSGSHIYGYPSKEGSDIDIRGFHLADMEEYALLDEPKEQIMFNQQGVTEGFGSHEDVEMVSYELKKFGRLLYKTNFNVLEFLFHGDVILNGDPLAVESLKQIMRENLPADVPYHYRGMAKQNYQKYLDKNRESYKPTAKKFLYVLRGLLAAEYTQRKEEIEPDINKLANEVLNKEDRKIIEKLIETKREEETEKAYESLRDSSHKLITKLFNQTEVETEKDGEKLEEGINSWMLKVRDV